MEADMPLVRLAAAARQGFAVPQRQGDRARKTKKKLRRLKLNVSESLSRHVALQVKSPCRTLCDVQTVAMIAQF